MSLEKSKRVRAVGIVFKEDQVLLIERRQKDSHYFVFPGGGLEQNESREGAAIREVEEETGIEAKPEKLLYSHFYDNNHEHHYYLCRYISGVPALQEGSHEHKKVLQDKDFYKPVWVESSLLSQLTLYPLEIRDSLCTDLKQGLSDTPKVEHVKISDLRDWQWASV